MATSLVLLPAFFVIAVLYSAVGLGGGSAYIAAMVFAGVPREALPIIALCCNLIVASESFFAYRRAGHFRWRLFWPFAITSVPFAYVGGSLHIPERPFAWILALALAVAAARLLFWRAPGNNGQGPSPEGSKKLLLFPIGAALGLLAGITGIGGGIYLIPAIILLGLAQPKEAAAAASLFIVVNSAAGLGGQLPKGFVDWRMLLPLAAAVLLGGLVGSRWGAVRLKGETLQRIVGAIMLIAVGKLIGGLL